MKILLRSRSTAAATVLSCLLLLSSVFQPLAAQQVLQPGVALLDAPVLQGSSSLSGIVVDSTGAAVAGVLITLSAADGSPARTTPADNSGAFLFPNLPAGTFQLTVTSAAGMGAYTSHEIQLNPGEQRQLPNIALAVAGTHADVEVTATQTQISAVQLQEELHQRALGVLPNFYSSYIWNAAPLDARQKFILALRSTTDPVNFIATGLIAGAEQAVNHSPAYGQGAQGYGKRYGATYADDFDARLIGSALLPVLLHQDPRYFYKGTGGLRSRFFYAVRSAVVTRGDNGLWQPNYSYVLGSFASGAISNAYHPDSDRGVGLTIGNGFLDIAGHAADDLIREFILRRFTSNVPATSTGQP